MMMSSVNWLFAHHWSLVLSAEHAVNEILSSVNSNNGMYHPSVTKNKHPY